jgi:hypothetical protein
MIESCTRHGAVKERKLTDRKSGAPLSGSNETMDQMKVQNIHNLKRQVLISSAKDANSAAFKIIEARQLEHVYYHYHQKSGAAPEQCFYTSLVRQGQCPSWTTLWSVSKEMYANTRLVSR